MDAKCCLQLKRVFTLWSYVHVKTHTHTMGVCMCVVDTQGFHVVTVVSHNSYQSCDHRKLVWSNGTHPSL